MEFKHSEDLPINLSTDCESLADFAAAIKDGYTMTGVQQLKVDPVTSEKPRGVLVQFPVPSAGADLSSEPEQPVPAPSLVFMPAEVVESRPGRSGQGGADSSGGPSTHTRARRVHPAQASPTVISNTAIPGYTGEAHSAETLSAGHGKPGKSWLKRLLFPDPPSQDKRGATRNQTPGLVAHFWTGGAPQAQPVRDISSTGLYVVTAERWYLGTKIRVTLTRTGGPPVPGPRTLTVQAVAVRYGRDGVGLAFVPTDEAVPVRRPAERAPLNGADAGQLEQFVTSLQPMSSSAV